MINSVSGAVLTLVVVALSIGGLILARRTFVKSHLQKQHDITDPYSQFVAMLFAVLLGFMVADAMQRFGFARAEVQQEASALGTVFRLAEGLPTDNKNRLRDLCLLYATEVVQDEWPMLAERRDSMKAWKLYRQLWQSCTTFESQSNKESNIQQALLSAMNVLGDSRRMRVEALHTGLPPVLWGVLIIGGLATMVFTYFFCAEDLKTQCIMVAMVSLVICLNLFLLAVYDDPFAGDVKVTPEAFETQIRLFKMEHQMAIETEQEMKLLHLKPENN